MSLEEMLANTVTSSFGPELGAKLIAHALIGATIYFPTIIAPALAYKFTNWYAAKLHTKINPLKVTLAATSIVCIPFGFLFGANADMGWFGFGNLAAYLFGATLLTYYHYSKSLASTAAQAPTK